MLQNEKIRKLKALGMHRQENCYPGFKNLADFHNGLYESDFVSPYTKGSGNVESRIFVMLQDWTSEERILAGLGKEAVELGYSPQLPTNINLQDLLKGTFDLNIADVFTTNLFPFIKPGKMDADIGNKWLKKSFFDYAMPQINVIQPRIVICCGKGVYKIVHQCIKGFLPKEVQLTQFFVHSDTYFFCQNHPGSRGTNNAGGHQGAKRNWLIMKAFLEEKNFHPNKI